MVNGQIVRTSRGEVTAPSSTQAKVIGQEDACALIAALSPINAECDAPNLLLLQELLATVQSIVEGCQLAQLGTSSDEASTQQYDCRSILALLAELVTDAVATANALLASCGVGTINTAGSVDLRDDACRTVIELILALPADVVKAVGELLADCGLVIGKGASASDSDGTCRDAIERTRAVVDLALGFVSAQLDGCGLRSFVGAPPAGTAITYQGYTCEEMVDGLIKDVASGTFIPGTPGMPGLFTFGCITPQGTRGSSNVRGQGGDGGDACVDNSGQDGGAGKPGNDGFWGCSAGGNGGNGGNAVDATAKGGEGGHGRDGGDDHDNPRTSID